MPARDTQVSQSGQEPSPKKFSGHRMSQDASSPLQNDPQGDDMICTQGTQPVVKQITDEGKEDDPGHLFSVPKYQTTNTGQFLLIFHGWFINIS